MQLVKSSLLLFTFTNAGRESVSHEVDARSFQPRVINGDAHDRERLEERCSEVQRHIRCVGRAVRLMLFLSALALVGLCYSTVLIPDWPQTTRQFLMYWPVKAHCALGFASLSCALWFFGLGLIYRRELIWLGIKVRNLATESTLAETARIIPLTNSAGSQPSPLHDAA